MSIPSSRDAVATSARNSPRFKRASRPAAILCHAAGVRGDVLLAETLGQMPRDALHLPRV